MYVDTRVCIIDTTCISSWYVKEKGRCRRRRFALRRHHASTTTTTTTPDSSCERRLCLAAAEGRGATARHVHLPTTKIMIYNHDLLRVTLLLLARTPYEYVELLLFCSRGGG